MHGICGETGCWKEYANDKIRNGYGNFHDNHTAADVVLPIKTSESLFLGLRRRPDGSFEPQWRLLFPLGATPCQIRPCD